MKRPITLLYHNPTERERLMARLAHLSHLTITPVRWRAVGEATDAVPMVCWCADVISALAAKDLVTQALLVLHPGQGEPLFSLLEDERCATCAIAESDELIAQKIERLRVPEAHRDGVGETGTYLTEREADVVRLLVSGLDTAQIARRLGIKAATVTAHKKHIFLKSGVRNTTQLVAWALIRNRPGGERGGTG